MAEGPEPMKNMKPVKKNPNGVDNFEQTNQVEYENHEEQRDKCEDVKVHNRACPKLIDELEQRRSVSRPMAINDKRSTTGSKQNETVSESRCKTCMKLKPQDKHDKRAIVKRKHYREKRSRVTKSRKQNKRRRHTSYRTRKLTVNRAIQYIPYTESKGTSHYVLPPSHFNMAEENMAGNELGSFTGQMVNENRNEQEMPGRKSQSSVNSNDIDSTKYPNTSVSSYNSFASLDHEPMVSP